MEKISKIIPPSRRTQYVELAKKNAGKQVAAEVEGSDMFQKPASRVSLMNAQRIETMLAKEKQLPGNVKGFDKETDDPLVQEIVTGDNAAKSAKFNAAADTSPDILENMVVNKTTTPIDRMNAVRAKEAAEFTQAVPYDKKQSASPLSASEAKKADYESLKEAKNLQAAKDIAKKFQVSQDNVEAKKEIKGMKPKSEAIVDSIERKNEVAARA